MPDIIQQLLDLKEWSQNPERYERRLNFRGAGLVQPGPGRQGYSGQKLVTHKGIKYPVITEKGHPHEGKIVYQGRTKKTRIKTREYLKDKEALIKRRALHATKTDVGRFTAKEAQAFRSKITKPEVGWIYLIKDRGGLYRIQVGLWGERFKTFKATEDNIIKAQDYVMDTYKKKYPNALLDSEFAELRLKDENINLSNEEFAQKLKKRTTQQGKKWTYQNVSQANRRAGIEDEVNPTRIKKYSIKQIKDIIRDSSGGQKFINANINNEGVLKREADRLLANKRSLRNAAGFPVSDNNSSKMWRNFYDSSRKGDRIKIRGIFNGKDIANRANWPKTKDGFIDWKARGTDDVPFYQKIKFQDTQAPNKAIFSWKKGEDMVGGNLKNQIDSVFGDGFFAKSTKAYSEQALDRKTMIKTKDGLKSISEILIEKLLIAEAKAEGIVPTKEYIVNKKQKYALKDVHHTRGIAKDPYTTESVLRSANRALGKYESDYAAGRMTKNQFIDKIREIGKEHGGIRREVDDVMVGKKATQESIMKKVMDKAGINKKTQKEFLKLVPKKSVTVPAGSSRVSSLGAVIDDALKADKFKGLRNLLKGEGIFAAADFVNNLSKGQSVTKAFQKAVEVASFETVDLGADEKALIKHATEKGASQTEIDAMRNYLKYMKKYKTYERANKMLHYAKENLGQGTGSPEDIGTTWEDVTDAAQNLKLREGELEDLYNIYTEGTSDMQLGSNMLTQTMNTLAAEEWNKTAGTFWDRGARPKQGEGIIWGGVGAIARDIGAIATGKMPTNFWDYVVPAQIDPFSKVEKQIRIMERPAVGVEYPEYQQALEDMKFDLGYALPEQNYAGGGIASLLKKK